jgi:hypothetical protein
MATWTVGDLLEEPVRILGLSYGFEVFRPDAALDAAQMVDFETFGYRSDLGSIRVPMGENGPPIQRKLAVAVGAH